jgi:hypothetical protein
MRRATNLLCLASLATMLTLPAIADDGFYLGASAGQSSLSATDLDDVEFDGDATGYKVFAGGRFLKVLGVEGSYVDFGDVQDDSISTAVDAEVTGVTLQGVAYLPLGVADIFIKGGLFQQSEITLTSSGPGAVVSDSGTSAVYGGGLQLRIKSFAVRAEVEYYEPENIDRLYMVSVGASYTF